MYILITGARMVSVSYEKKFAIKSTFLICRFFGTC